MKLTQEKQIRYQNININHVITPILTLKEPNRLTMKHSIK